MGALDDVIDAGADGTDRLLNELLLAVGQVVVRRPERNAGFAGEVAQAR